MAEQASTGRVRRTSPAPPVDTDPVMRRSKYRDGTVLPAVPTPAVRPAPHGDLSRASVDAIVDLVGQVWQAADSTIRDRRRAVRGLLDVLQQVPGETWQQRWDASDYAQAGFPPAGARKEPGAGAGLGFKLLLCLRVFRAGLQAIRATAMVEYAQMFRLAQADVDLDRFYAHVEAMPVPGQARRTAGFDVACALTAFGIRFAELTPAGFLQYAWDCRRDGLGAYTRGQTTTFAGQVAWQALRESGHFPPDTPPTIQAAGQRGQLTVTGLVDRYTITNQAVRQLLIDYLTRRSAVLDYSSLTGLARWLAGVFWSKVEKIAPGQADLRIPANVYDQWRASIRLREDGKERLSVDPILLAVRSFYLDLHTWAVAEPERWATWVAPCPINPGDFAGSARRHRKARERSAERTRTRQPLLPTLVAEVSRRRDLLRRLLAAGANTPPGQTLTVDGRTYTRVWTGHDTAHAEGGNVARVRVHDEDSGQTINVTRAEDAAFWEWAIVETLRLSGIRIEELLELSQLSIRRYQRPNGETIALLVVAPSKSDRERVIPMSAELFTVIAAIIRRHTDQTGGIPTISRYDTHEKIHTPAMPFLFQRQRGPTRSVFGQHVVLDILRRRCAALAETRPDFGQARFTPHDFRRIFATDLVNNGLPIHIGAALLGHLNLETTRGYVAVFEEDLIRHYQAFLDRRRRMRPVEEYRPATDAEWVEFEEHFDKRKVELGNCGRPYGTGCAHEHACLRCPMLHVHPDMLPRLDAIETDLLTRRSRAEAEHWLGEMEGIDITLTRLADKRQQAQRLARTSVVPLGLPTMRTTGERPA